jgi:hypothetical protein
VLPLKAAIPSHLVSTSKTLLFVSILLARSPILAYPDACYTGDGRLVDYPKYYNPAMNSYDFTDADATRLEGRGPAIEEKLTAPLKVRLNCLRAKIAHVGGKHKLESAYRPYQYQDHFFDLYQLARLFRSMDMEDEDNAICRDIAVLVSNEMASHDFNVAARANSGKHVLGMAFDLSFTLPGSNRILGPDMDEDEYFLWAGADPPMRYWECAWGWCEFGISFERDEENYPVQKCHEGTNYQGPLEFGVQAGVEALDLLESCDENESYTEGKADYIEFLKGMVTIDFFAQRCGLWRALYPRIPAERTHFQCISNQECVE